MLKFIKIMRSGLRDPDYRDVIVSTVTLLAVGTIFYRLVEHWPVLDSFYFCVITLTTVGFGDLSPETDVGKAFTTIYVLAGIGLIMAFAQSYLALAAKMRETKSGGDDG